MSRYAQEAFLYISPRRETTGGSFFNFSPSNTSGGRGRSHPGDSCPLLWRRETSRVPTVLHLVSRHAVTLLHHTLGTAGPQPAPGVFSTILRRTRLSFPCLLAGRRAAVSCSREAGAAGGSLPHPSQRLDSSVLWPWGPDDAASERGCGQEAIEGPPCQCHTGGPGSPSCRGGWSFGREPGASGHNASVLQRPVSKRSVSRPVAWFLGLLPGSGQPPTCPPGDIWNGTRPLTAVTLRRVTDRSCCVTGVRGPGAQVHEAPGLSGTLIGRSPTGDSVPMACITPEKLA